MAFGCIGTMTARPGRRDEVIALLTGGSEGLKAVGCRLYVVGADADDDTTIWVSEVWESEEHHRASLEPPETRAAIATAMPMLTGGFSGHRMASVGGLGAED
jgi:quinol monooxygenase YgiN